MGGLSSREVDVFNRLDLDSNGVLDLAELIAMCEGDPTQNEEGARVLLKTCDLDRNNKVTLAEWQRMWHRERKEHGASSASGALAWMDKLHTEAEKTHEVLLAEPRLRARVVHARRRGSAPKKVRIWTRPPAQLRAPSLRPRRVDVDTSRSP